MAIIAAADANPSQTSTTLYFVRGKAKPPINPPINLPKI